eukprot:37530-Eustigmatos_ZCMA.PRE.1
MVDAGEVQLEQEGTVRHQQELTQREALQQVVYVVFVRLQAHVQAHGDRAHHARDGDLRGGAGGYEDDQA